jgi:hypothetical protein
MTSRRELLSGLGAGLLASIVPRVGAADPSYQSGPVCNYSVLQIFLYQGLAHRQTLWCGPGPGPDMSAVHASAAGAAGSVFLVPGQVPGVDDMVTLGAGFAPIAAALDRTRLVTTRGDADVHEVASAYALTGEGIGRPDASSLGARIQWANGTGGVPASWVLDAGRLGRITRLATRTGPYGSGSRPFVIPVGSDAFVERLDRAGRDQVDLLLDLYRDTYVDRATHATGPVRSDALDVYSDTVDRMIDWQDVHALLADGPSLSATAAGYIDNRLVRGVRYAGHLLANGARHVCVLGGETAAPGLDTHNDFPVESEADPPDPTDALIAHATRHNGVLWGVTNELMARIVAGELDLDHTIVLIHSEFGRGGFDGNGTNHHIGGFVSALIGGPVTQRGLAGHLDFGENPNGIAVAPVPQADLLDALAIAAGVDAAVLGVADPAALTTTVFGASCA